MRCSLSVVGGCFVLFVACQQAGGPSALQSPGAPSSMSAAATRAASATERPWKANLAWGVTRLEWPEGQPPFSGTTGTFGGRCSVPSDYVIYATFDGVATHGGRFTGDGSHCSQLHLGPAGPTNITYSDGRGTLRCANGSTLDMRYGSGSSWTDEKGVTFFKDHFVFTGGTGIFAGATGSGEEGGSFTDFTAVITGTPATMWQRGKIAYGPQNR